MKDIAQRVIDDVGDALFHLFDLAGIEFPAQTATACLHAIADRLDEVADSDLGAAIRTTLWEEHGLIPEEIKDELEFDNL